MKESEESNSSAAGGSQCCRNGTAQVVNQGYHSILPSHKVQSIQKLKTKHFYINEQSLSIPTQRIFTQMPIVIKVPTK